MTAGEDARAPRPRVARRPGAGLFCVAAAVGTAAVGSLWGSAVRAMEFAEGEGVYTLVLLRHGQSQWNLENRFTGWVDVDVTDEGAEEAMTAGRLLRDAKITVDVAFTSLQKRAIKTLALALEEMDQLWIPISKTWRLNERMYGDLQGMNKAETQAKFGEEQVTQWRRSFAIPPPEISDDNPFHPKLEEKYASIPKKDLPLTESLDLTIKRVLPYWRKEIAPALRRGKKVIIAAHGNSLRALVKYLDNIPEDKIIKLNIPTAVPLVYKLNRQLKPVMLPGHAAGLSGVYLGDPEWVNNKINGVANQAKR
mmetsp:Transcript_58463/g.131487  ORF Transcript_58463/g.131487 Transcript_58463/m.131487 type:complete len:309 (-) Transcript_58463:101-1027(-)